MLLADQEYKAFKSLLLKDGLIRKLGKGLVTLDYRFLHVMDVLEKGMRNISKEMGANEVKYPTLISKDELTRFEFFKSFPQFASYVDSPDRAKAKQYVLRPAICYHAYQDMRKVNLQRSLHVISSSGSCFRAEGARLTNTPERLWDFTMREIIFFGSANAVDTLKQKITDKVIELAAEHGISQTIVLATDPFFLGENRGKLLLQKLKGLKLEMRAGVSTRKAIAITSFNNHQMFFCKKAQILDQDKKIAHSGCVAFGLERWAYAFLCQHGMDQNKWPRIMKI